MSGRDFEAEKLRFEMARLAPRDRYKLLSGVVIPRPVACAGAIRTSGLQKFAFTVQPRLHWPQ